MAAQIYAYRKKSKKKMILTVGSGVIVLLLAAFSVWYFTRSDSQDDKLQFTFPGAQHQTAIDLSDDEDAARQLYERIEALLFDPSEQIWYRWYQLEARLGDPPAELSDETLISDQLLYGQYLLEQQDRRAFLNWWEAFETGFLHIEAAEGSASAEIGYHVRYQPVQDTFRLLRILGQSCTLWPDQSRLNLFYAMSDDLLTYFDSGFPANVQISIPTPEPTLDPAASPTPWPEDQPEPDPSEQPRREAVSLSSIDLFTLQALTHVDTRWQDLYNRSTKLVLNGYLHDDLPLFALAWDPETEIYLRYSGAMPGVDLEASLMTLLHLAEIGQAPQRSLAWLRGELINRRVLYTEYDIIQGVPINQNESILSYALAARIARVTDDQILYDQAIEKLLWHRATSPTSEALSAIFEVFELHEATGQELVHVRADHNLWAMLSLK